MLHVSSFRQSNKKSVSSIQFPSTAIIFLSLLALPPRRRRTSVDAAVWTALRRRDVKKKIHTTQQSYKRESTQLRGWTWSSRSAFFSPSSTTIFSFPPTLRIGANPRLVPSQSSVGHRTERTFLSRLSSDSPLELVCAFSYQVFKGDRFICWQFLDMVWTVWIHRDPFNAIYYSVDKSNQREETASPWGLRCPPCESLKVIETNVCLFTHNSFYYWVKVRMCFIFFIFTRVVIYEWSVVLLDLTHALFRGWYLNLYISDTNEFNADQGQNTGVVCQNNFFRYRWEKQTFYSLFKRSARVRGCLPFAELTRCTLWVK